MFLSAKALLVRDGYDVSSHRTLIGIFGREYVKNGDFDSSIAKYLSGTQSLRDNADYDAIDTISKEIAQTKEILDLCKTLKNNYFDYNKKQLKEAAYGFKFTSNNTFKYSTYASR